MNEVSAIKMASAEKIKPELLKDGNVYAIFLTGSVARGTAKKSSDVDLLCFTREKLLPNTMDNIVNFDKFGEKFQFLYVSEEEVVNDIKGAYSFRIEELRNSKPLYDKEGLWPKLKKLADEQKFGVNIKARLDLAYDGYEKVSRLIEDGNYEFAKLAALEYSSWLARDIIEYNNCPSTGAKDMKEKLGRFDPQFLVLFRKLLGSDKVQAEEYSKNMKELLDYSRKKYSKK